MIEMNLLNHVVEVAALVPVLGAIYKIYLKNPIIANSRASVQKAMDQIRGSEVVELPVGTHDVTPNGATQNYIIDVFDVGYGDNAGNLQVSHPDGNSFIEMEMEQNSRAASEVVSDGKKLLYGNQGYVEAIAEPIGIGKDVRIFGLLVYKPKGQAIFTDE